jgi:hypothetical protein
MLYRTGVKLKSFHAVQCLLNYTTLDHLYLSNNSLTHFDADVFQQTAGVTSLISPEKLLDTLHHGVFPKQTNLYFLSPTNNRLTILSDSRLFPFQGTKSKCSSLQIN